MRADPGRRLRPLMLACAVAAAACNPILGPSEVDANWRVYDSAHFALHARHGSFAEQQSARLAEVLEDQYAVTLATLGITYAGRISMFLYTSAADGDLMSERSGVAYPSTEAVRAVCVAPLDGSLYVLLSHEANHVIQKNALGRPGTSMLNEGLPSAVLSETHHSYGPSFLHSWSAAHLSTIPPIAELADDDRWEGFNQQMAYNASASFLAYLIETRGAGRVRQLYQAGSSEFETRFREVYGQPVAEVDLAWRAFVQRAR